MRSSIERPKVVYFIKRPNSKGRSSFAVVKKTTPPNGKPIHTTLQHERIDTLNSLCRAGNLDFNSANEELKKFCKELNLEKSRLEKGVWVSSEDNRKLLEQYWEAAYSRRKLKRKDSARYRLEQAIGLLGPHSLLDSIQTIQGLVDTRCKGHPRTQRKMASTLNQMRRWFGIGKEPIALERRTRPIFRYLTRSEFLQVLPLVEGTVSRRYRTEVSAETYKSLFQCLFYTGVRSGEAFALEARHRRKNTVQVLTQIDRYDVETETKNGRERKTIIFDEGQAAFDSWISALEKTNICRGSLARVLRRACKKAFPNNPKKWLCAHDLRHSFAVMCLQDYGFSIDDIAQFLGNGVQVCQEHYLNFVPEDENLDALFARKVSAAQKR